MVTYDSAYNYIESCTTLRDKITRIEAIITALEDTALKAAANDNITEYMLNDGQTIIKTVYKGADAVMRSIEAYEKLKERYVNKLNGRTFKLVDSKNFNRYGSGR
jgi:hypothetical protein